MGFCWEGIGIGRFGYFLLGGVVGAVIVGAGFLSNDYLIRAYEKRIEGDSRQYLIVESDIRRTPMIRTDPNQPYKRINLLQEEMMEIDNLKTMSLIERVLSLEE